ncbi:MAG TPA: bifunctional aspartate kinase/homoserine dehydrogenase I, partial [Saprospiraceae bacterium]|nr:bifunctional aspartate kinase/homoserine dehydrogenase I [Saprospiraceae bacterium]
AQHFHALGNVLHGIFLLHEVSPRSLDFVGSFGERNSAFLISHAMRQAGIPADFLDARDVIRTDAHFGAAKVDFEATNRLVQAHYATHAGRVQAVTGFIGSTADGITTTLGRGGSDYTAAILGAALHAEAIEIWTDVDGVLTADPRRVKKAFTLPTMTYREAMEMSHFGAKVIYPPTIQPALAQGIPLVIKNTFHPEFPGTFIGVHASAPAVGGPAAEAPISGISSINQINLLTLQGSGLFGVPGIAGRLFGALARAGVNVVIITQGSSESSITFAVSPGHAKAAQLAAEQEFGYEIREQLIEPLRIESDLSVVAVVGENMRYRPGIAGRLFQALGKNGVNIVAIAQGSSELNISVIIPAADETKALNAIHDAFFLSGAQSLHLYLVGVGLIGSTLLGQIAAQADFLREKRGLDIKVAGLANSRQMVFHPEGLDLSRWKEALEGGQPFSMPEFLEQMRTLNLPNAIFIDNTASAEVAGYYDQILDESISVSTPNKQAASSPFAQYRRLKDIAAKRGVLWRYETNVGAGLPIINTLNDLLHSGDSILKIEGILSGTLSFIFNQFCHADNRASFSSIVAEAKRRGLTEPDPRDDLSGADVRRKLLILARETGLALEAADIEVENILPAPCLAAPTVEEFFRELERCDGHFEALRQEAEAQGKVLRFVATLEGNAARVVLRSFDTSHPFYFLSGSDNMVVFSTDRYRERPLVVRGPGAGAEVTAAGVFAEVISIGTQMSE